MTEVEFRRANNFISLEQFATTCTVNVAKSVPRIACLRTSQPVWHGHCNCPDRSSTNNQVAVKGGKVGSSDCGPPRTTRGTCLLTRAELDTRSFCPSRIRPNPVSLLDIFIIRKLGRRLCIEPVCDTTSCDQVPMSGQQVFCYSQPS